MHLIFNRKIYFTDFSIINGTLVIDSGKNPLYDFPKMGESKTVENFSENSSILVVGGFPYLQPTLLDAPFFITKREPPYSNKKCYAFQIAALCGWSSNDDDDDFAQSLNGANSVSKGY